MTLDELRAALPQYEIEDHPEAIGYWLRIAGQPCPPASYAKRGWERADRELQDEAEDAAASA